MYAFALARAVGAVILIAGPVSAVRAETGGAIDQKIDRLEEQIRAMKSELAQYRHETRHVRAQVQAVAQRASSYALPPPSPPVPSGAVPTFITADKKLISAI